MRRSARLPCLEGASLRRIGNNDKDRDVGEILVRLHLGGERIPVHAYQIAIHEDRARPGLLRDTEGARARYSTQCLHPGHHRGKSYAHPLDEGRIVVNDQNPCFSHPTRPPRPATSATQDSTTTRRHKKCRPGICTPSVKHLAAAAAMMAANHREDRSWSMHA